MDWIIQKGTCTFCGVINAVDTLKHDCTSSIDGGNNGDLKKIFQNNKKF